MGATCRAMNEAWRGSQRMFFRTGGAAGKAGHAHGCGKAHLFHRGVDELASLSVAIRGVVGLSLGGT